jgi:class 3 adenylate cyclase
LAQQLSGAELARAVGEFETAAYDLALSHDGRVVKFIGDEAMFVSSDPEAACAIGVGLCEVVGSHSVLDRARGAVGLGEALSQNGDFYGPTVNLVSRLTGIAGPDEILGTAPLAAAMAQDGAPFEFTPAGAHQLRGFTDPVEAFTISRRA